MVKNKFNFNKSPLFLIDGSSFIYRAFYAFQDLKTRDGFPTSALYIVLRLILKIRKDLNPDLGCFIIDGKGPTFRHEIETTYKANRLKMPEPLSIQIPVILEGMNLLGIKTIVAEHAEADDYIASIVERFKLDLPVIIVGSDKDLLQLLDKNVLIWDPSGKNEKIITLEEFKTQKGIDPSSWPLYQALVGDSSDNIKGIPGIGPKTALKLLKKYPTIEELKKNIDKLPVGDQKKLRGNFDKLEKYLYLTSLKKDVPIEKEINWYKVHPMDSESFRPFLLRYEFHSLIKELALDTKKCQDPETGSRENSPLPKKNFSLSNLDPEEIGIIPKDIGFLIGDKTTHDLVIDKNKVIKKILETKNTFVPSLKEFLYAIRPNECPFDNIFDLSLGAYLIDPELRDYSLKNLVQRYSHVISSREGEISELIEIGSYVFDLLKQNSLMSLYTNIERPLVPVLISMEKNGIKIDIARFKAFLKEVEKELNHLSEKIYYYAGQVFNIRSNKQLSEILFKKMGLKSGKKTPKGEPSTASDVLESIKKQHPIVQDILTYRKLEKLRSTYLSPFPKFTDKNNRIHTHFNQLATATGRLSSSNPNLQNIPIKGEFGPKMRSCFVAEKGHLLISADYSQIELRVLAHFSEDPYLVNAFLNNMDIHLSTASALFSKDPKDITPDERRKAKTINFGFIYGMGPQKLSRELGISITEAKKFIEIYFSKFSKVKEFFEKVELDAKKNGYVSTLSGRRRFLPNINSQNNNLASQARRMAINTKIQGSAADIIKLSMLEVYNNSQLKKLDVKLILQIHDELLFECGIENGQEAGEIINQKMSSVVKLNVPLKVDWGIGENWAQAH